MAYIVMAYIVLALYSYGLYSYGLYRYVSASTRRTCTSYVWSSRHRPLSCRQATAMKAAGTGADCRAASACYSKQHQILK